MTHYGLSKTVWRTLMRYYPNETMFVRALDINGNDIGELIVLNDNASVHYHGNFKDISWSRMIGEARRKNEGNGREIRIGTIQTNKYPM